MSTLFFYFVSHSRRSTRNEFGFSSTGDLTISRESMNTAIAFKDNSQMVSQSTSSLPPSLPPPPIPNNTNSDHYATILSVQQSVTQTTSVCFTEYEIPSTLDVQLPSRGNSDSKDV